MQQKKLVYTFIILAVCCIAIFFIAKKWNQTSPGMSFPDREFAYANIEEIHTIEMDRPKYPKQIFTRKGIGWILNDKYDVNDGVFNNFLIVLKKISIDYIPTKAATEVILNDNKSNGIKISLYDKSGKKVRSYTVGTETANGLGTPFVMEGSRQPYIMVLPGLEGSVRRRMTFDINEWKNKDIFHEKAEDLQSFEISYPKDKNSSFKIVHNNNGYEVVNPDVPSAPRRPTNQKTVSFYLDNLKKIEGEYNDENNSNKPEILKFSPFCIVKINYKNGQRKVLNFISYMDLSNGGETTSPNQIHEDNKFFISTSEGQFLLCQYRVLKYVLKPNMYFY